MRQVPRRGRERAVPAPVRAQFGQRQEHLRRERHRVPNAASRTSRAAATSDAVGNPVNERAPSPVSGAEPSSAIETVTGGPRFRLHVRLTRATWDTVRTGSDCRVVGPAVGGGRITIRVIIRGVEDGSDWFSGDPRRDDREAAFLADSAPNVEVAGHGVGDRGHVDGDLPRPAAPVPRPSVCGLSRATAPPVGFYERSGFRPTGERAALRSLPVGAEERLHRTLSPAAQGRITGRFTRDAWEPGPLSRSCVVHLAAGSV